MFWSFSGNESAAQKEATKRVIWIKGRGKCSKDRPNLSAVVQVWDYVSVQSAK